ncbi:hypothetical protein PLESTM_000385400 [Pleodorina starrii]|nr:hypothetical protein PLESTM_000385400 [Pleodorina starrii]
MQHSGTGRETGLVDDEDDDLISWRLHLERQRQLAAERAEQMDLLRAYRYDKYDTAAHRQRWAALDRLLQDERPALRAGDAAARVPGGAAADEVVVVAEQAPHHGGPMLQLGDIPWPPSTSGMLHGLAQLEAQRSGPGASPASPRALLRRAYLSAVRRWHPDKSAAVLAALPPGDRAAARARLLAVCQELNRQHEEALRQQL